jgi:hypothetical protein
MYTAFTFEKIAKLLVILLKFLQKLPKVISHPIGEKSPNLVTLVGTDCCFSGMEGILE